MAPSGRAQVAWSVLSLSRTRSVLLERRYRFLVGVVGLGYALVTMVVGGMLYFPAHPLSTGWFFLVYPSGPGPAWTYPAILAGGPMFQVDLPIAMGILLTLNAAGIGLGMSLAVFLGVRLARSGLSESAGPSASGSAFGLTPILFSLVTLGACCSTTAAATAGIALVGRSTGISPAAAAANAWYLGVVQVAVVYVALLAQEQLLRLFGSPLLAPAERRSIASRVARDPTPAPARRGASVLLRLILVAAGLSWTLAALAEESTVSSSGVSPWTAFGGIFQHAVPGLLAVLLALFPRDAWVFWERYGKRAFGLVVRGVLIAGGLTLLLWVPAPMARNGAAALGNELLGFWRFPTSWGAVAPPFLDPVGLLIRWAFQFLLLGVFAVVVGIAPLRAMRPILWSSRDGRELAPSSESLPEGSSPGDIAGGLSVHPPLLDNH